MTDRSEYTGREIVDVIEEVDLYDANGDKIGDVLEISPDFLVVDTGEGEPQRIPVSQTTQMENGRDLQLAGGYGSTGSSESTMSSSDSDYETAGVVSTGSDYQGSSTSTTETGDTLRVPVHEEELYATKQVQEAGEVEIRKNVVEEQRTLNVPVMREEVEVVRRQVDGSEGFGAASADAFQEGEISVPLREETVEVTKTPRVVEEIELRKATTQDTEQVTDTVRREEVEIVDEANTTGSSGYAGSGTGTAGWSQGGGNAGSGSGDDDTAGRVGGGAAGALGGAALGTAVGGPVGTVIGGVGGALAGSAAGDKAEDAVEGDEHQNR